MAHACAGLSACQRLETLLLKGNRLTSLAGLGACSRLQHLDASFNHLAAMPTQDLPHAQLRHLSLNGNRRTRFALYPNLLSAFCYYSLLLQWVV